MNGKERVLATFNRQYTDRCPLWKGNPVTETGEELAEYYKTSADPVSLSSAMGDDLVWLEAGHFSWPKDVPFFDTYKGIEHESLGQEGYFAQITAIEEIEHFPWPDLDRLDFEPYRKELLRAKEAGLAVAGGFWCPFFHVMADFLGMENYFVRMYTDPDFVAALTTKVVDIYLEANRRCFETVGDLIDISFFGNDFGTQRDLLITPDMFRTFVLPEMQRITEQSKHYGKFVMLHSCGSIYRVIPDLINIGVDGLHPLQALAANMAPEDLVKYKDNLIFMGSVDAQHLLPFGKPDEIRVRINEITDLLGPGYIISPSHEALMTDVPLENILAMCQITSK